MEEKKKDDIVTVELIPINKKSVNGRIYSKSVLKRAFQKFFNKYKDLLVVNRINEKDPLEILTTSVIGVSSKQDCQITDKQLIVNIQMLNPQLAEDISTILKAKKAVFTPVGTGIVDPETHKVKNYEIHYISLQEI